VREESAFLAAGRIPRDQTDRIELSAGMEAAECRLLQGALALFAQLFLAFLAFSILALKR
jgi:hypothetical protein